MVFKLIFYFLEEEQFMKKVTFLAITLLCLCFFACGVFAQSNPVIVETPTLKVVVNGKQLDLTNVPINCNGRVLLGLREVLVALGVENNDEHIIWNPANRSVRIIHDGVEIYLAIGNKKATVNGVEIELDAEPVIYKDRTYIPTRFVAQSLSKLVFWDKSAYSVVITDEDRLNLVSAIVNSEVNNPKRPVHIIQEEVLKIAGNEIGRLTYDIISDPNKGTEYIQLTENVGGRNVKTEIYDDGTSIYKKPDYRDKWIKKEKSGESKIDVQDKETLAASFACLVVKENNNQRVVIEGESLAYALNGPFDVLKDKTSKCHITMQYGVYTDGNDFDKIVLESVETVITGSRDTLEGIKPYEFRRNVRYMLGETVIAVPVPSDLNNSYTVPKGMNEYYNSKGYTINVPDSWNLPAYDEESPVISYEDKTDSSKWCAIIIDTDYSFGTGWSIYDLKPAMTDSAKDSVNNGKIISSENFKWKGYDAVRITVSGQSKSDGGYIKEQFIAVNYNGIFVVFTYLGETSTFDAKLNEAQKIIDSWDLPVFG